ncbi:type IV pilus biogenesis protein PilP [Palleronia marisminoris]|uniref:Type IV pilus biogenesis n=1 Tax=Palleronia marisminoris TaxID=315423 RepID=A0A1Y5RG96_9RHOB|nr:hypothetical protein [Palleronia marisminoris]SFG17904.1 type IV pilus biogenesis protein PilP [Palleronia marisminoris]SLN16790.1 Type IV pilus biogenesis [Palleronia marisminoris]
MKYDFALDFTPEGVRLLKGSGDDQVVFGYVVFNDPHFDTRVEDLRKEAEDDHGGPFATALLLPHSEVLFHTMKVEEGTEITEKAVRAELDGMTPYDIDSLAYDWKTLSKTQAEIAAVARETLAEADAFAAAHGFGPGPYSTPPNSKAFRGQPDFGASDRPMPKPAPIPEPEPAPTPAAAPKAELPAPKPEVPATALPAPKAPEAPPPAVKEDAAKPVSATPTGPDTPRGPAPSSSKPANASAGTDTPAPPKADPKPEVSARKPEEPPLIDDFAEPNVTRAGRTDGPTGAPPPKKPAEKSNEAETPASFASRRTSSSSGTGAAAAIGTAVAAGAAAGVATAATATRLGSIASRAASSPDGGAGPSQTSRAPAKEAPKTKAGPLPPQRRTTAPAPTEPSGRTAAPGRGAPTPTVRKVETPDSVRGAAKSLSTAPGSADPKPRLSEAESLTVFGMRGSPTRRTSAMLPIVIGLVVALLLAVLVWTAFYFVSDTEDTAPEIEQSSVLPVDDALPATEEIEDSAVAVDATADNAPVVEDSAIVDASPEEPAAEVESVAEVEPEAPEVVETAPEEPAPTDAATPDPALEPGPDDPLRRPEDAPEATRYAATGVSTAAPSTSDTPVADSPDLAGSQGDSTIRVQDGVAALQAPELAALSAPTQLAPPPPPGARFELDENGRVLATPEGTMSPQGVRITSGQPPVVPPQSPERPAATTEAAAPVDESSLEVPVTDGQPDMTPPERIATPDADATEQAVIGTPMARPDGVSVTRRTSLDDVEDDAMTPGSVALTGLEGPQDTPDGVVQTPSDAQVVLAALSPRARPEREIPQQDLPQISEEQSAAQAQAVATAIASIIPGLDEATDEAVARSLRPGNRPQNFAATVEQAREAAPVQVAAASAVVTPRNPTTGSVASRATSQNAIRLNQINLIGVYGTESSRRALIRLPSGRFVKVQVGDRVDGGRVSAIASDKLQYVKGGRQVVLSIPAG